MNASYTVTKTTGITGTNGEAFPKGATVVAGVDFPEAQVTDLLASESIELLELAGHPGSSERARRAHLGDGASRVESESLDRDQRDRDRAAGR